ncbi:carbohydrate-binding module family 24 protein [Pleomassaria siparia CBS 279.74]|uniref:Carbohydrate-binding module family 24 protein n=1 Tax=Pleomassaria siparia CBS 279.74 TaxID=1314801 RepID=A0A6G1KKL3_9PLEO|nr:carbohydrate-binding module family 24 protein [Pleomassaria siparia CBS 279.74]
MRFLIALVALISPVAVYGKSVFAHFMVGNTAAWNNSDWTSNIQMAQAAGIDAFALNMANDEDTTDTQLPLAFAAAESLGFSLFFSFDYAGNGAWSKATVTSLIEKYATSSAYFHRGSQPFVSTFEGPLKSDDWTDIKKSTGCFFIPDWSSLGAKAAVELSDGVADGLFSWDAWPKGPANSNTYPDASYLNFLGGKPYMAPVSPWFYTNMPGYSKNWLWHGDSLWNDRWQQLIAMDNQPEYVEIISWNDFGESHYIGPLDDRQYTAFDTGRAPFNYAKGVPHDGWRTFLRYFITLWKNGVATVTQEGIVGWYRLNPATACADGGTTGNTATQLQLEYYPSDVVEDKVFFQSLLGSAATVSVTVGGVALTAEWTTQPYGGIGMYFGSASTNGATGAVVITVSRNGGQVASLAGESITTSCSSGLNNFNAWVGDSLGSSVSATTPANTTDLTCVEGFGFGKFNDICTFTCKNGYCPSGACTCTALGVADPPEITADPGYPLAGASPSWEGICSFACNHGYCPSDSCSPTPQTEVLPTTGEFLPSTCTRGAGSDPFTGLCSFGCNLGFCPIHLCSCTTTGPLNVPPSPDTSITGSATDSYQDYGICNFACERDYCPYPCTNSTLPGGVFVPDPDLPGFSDTPWPLLYISDGSTTVHLDTVTSALVYNLLQDTNTCPGKKRDLTDCLIDTFDFLMSNVELAAAIVELYMGSPVAGTPKTISDLPRYSDDTQQAAFLGALLTGASQLERVMVELSDPQVIYMTYAVMNIAIQQIWNHPSTFDSFSVGRSGKMTAECPATEDVACSHQLCKGGDNSICSGFLSPCSCSQGNQCPNEDKNELALSCDSCGGVDSTLGVCMGASTYKGCPCVATVEDDPYMWELDPSGWISNLNKYYAILAGDDYTF